MSSYQYVNGCYVVNTPITEPYRRFHGCNAQHANFTVYDDSRQLLPRYDVYQFISYATKVCQVLHDLKHDRWRIVVDCRVFNYSPTTTRQVGRWIRETFGGVFDVTDIRHALTRSKPVTPNMGTYDITGSITCDVVSNAKLESVWR